MHDGETNAGRGSSLVLDPASTFDLSPPKEPGRWILSPSQLKHQVSCNRRKGPIYVQISKKKFLSSFPCPVPQDTSKFRTRY